MTRTYYRAVEQWPVTRDDFLSDEAKGRRPRREQIENPVLYTGVSVFAGPFAIAVRRERFPAFPRHTVALSIPEGAPVRVEKTLGRGHHTVIGDADLLMSYVVGLVE